MDSSSTSPSSSTLPSDPTGAKNLAQPQHTNNADLQLDLVSPEKVQDANNEASHSSTPPTEISEACALSTAANTDQRGIVDSQPNGTSLTQEPTASTPSTKRRRKSKAALLSAPTPIPAPAPTPAPAQAPVPEPELEPTAEPEAAPTEPSPDATSVPVSEPASTPALVPVSPPTQAEAEAKAEAKAEAEAEAEVETEAEAKEEAGTGAEAQAEAQAETQVESEPEAKPEAKPGPEEPEAKVEAQTEGQEEAQAQTQEASEPTSASVSEPVTPPQPGDPLPKLTNKAKLPKLNAFELYPEQLKHPLFVAIARVLVVYGNAWQSATDLVDGIRRFNLASLGGRTPRGTIQGAISTALSLAHSLRTFEPIEKNRMNGTTYYRLAPAALNSNLQNGALDSDATESDSNDTVPRKGTIASGSKNGRLAVSKAQSEASTYTAKRKPKKTANRERDRKNKKRTVSGWRSDTLSSDSSEDDSPDRSSNGRRRPAPSTGSKRPREESPNSSRPKAPARRDSLPNGLKKLPKGYVYDTEFNQAALMNLSVNPSQTGEYMRHLRGKSAQENNYPDRRGEYGVDLTQEPSIFALEQQTGYTYPRLRTSGRERLPKGDCEDGYAIADLKHNGTYLGRLFCLTDGHGGRACSSFVIATIPGAMQVILGKYKPADLSLPSVQELVKAQITEAIRLIDKEYLDYKKQQYMHFKNKLITTDPGSDGTTLIVNIFIDKWIICLNLGDSRTMMGSRDSGGRWNVDFYSEDHTPALERLAQTIYANGGEFVTHDDKVIRFDPNLKNDKKHRQSLREARIRVKDAASNPYGIPYMTKNGHCASVNLGACIGDVLYKLDPVNPVLSCKPDITFIDITDIQQGFLLMASDGLWDYVQRGGKVQDQNMTVCQFVGDKIDRGWNHQRIVAALSDREGSAGLYSDSIQEYDDFTGIVVIFSKQQLQRQQQQYQENEQRQILLHQQRLQEQKILLLQQHHQKQETERPQRIQPVQIPTEPIDELERLRREQELLRQHKLETGDDDTDSDLTEPEPERKRRMIGLQVSTLGGLSSPSPLSTASTSTSTSTTTTVAATPTVPTAVATTTIPIDSPTMTTRSSASPGRKDIAQREPPEIEMDDVQQEAGTLDINGDSSSTSRT